MAIEYTKWGGRTMKIEIAPRSFWLNESKYDQGKLHCFFLEIDGKRGWRLPNVIEANHLVDAIEISKSEIPADLIEFSEYWIEPGSLGFWTIEDQDVTESLCDDFTVIPVRYIE